MIMGELTDKLREKVLECIYDKTYTCPVCDNIFKNKTIKLGKVKIVSTGIDLKPEYTPINSMFYSIVSCQLCGYTSLDISFDRIGLKQSVVVRQTLAQKFVAREYPEIYDVNTAIIRYKLALICADLKRAKKSEFAHIALRLSWFYSDIGNEQKTTEYRQHAYEYFKETFGSENFSLYGYDESTVMYIIAALAYELGEMDEALKWVSSVVVGRNIQPRLKQKSLDLKDLIRANKENKNNEVI